MPSMYGPNRSPYGGYGNYWGGYGRPPHPPPPPPLPPHDPPTFHPPPPPPLHFRPMRPPPSALRPPPPPPPIRLPRPQQQQSYPNQPPQGRQQTENPQERKTSLSTSYRPQTNEQQSNQQNSRPRHSNGGIPSRRPPDSEDEPERLEADPPITKQLEPLVGSPLVPRRKEPEPPPPVTKPPIPNNKRPLPVELDPNLPEELVAKFHNNSCELCDVKLNSRIQAKNHYEGKQHRKKVKNYIIEHARKDGQPPEKIAKIDLSTPKKKVEPLDVSQLYCKCCDLSFTSEQHAQQHYMGRNHQRVLHGLKPLKAGYYNKETGKWQRMPPDPRVSVERMGLNLEPPSEEGMASQNSEKPLDPDAVKERGRFFCELCNVSATSQDQLDGHMTGQRHLKALRLNAKKTTTASTGPADSILASVIKADEVKKPKSKDLSIYRTPSGKYYCSPCDLTLNSESQFAQHVESKKHKTRRVK